MKILFVKYSTNRNPEYQIMTTIAQDDAGQLAVIKDAAHPAAAGHIKAIHEHARLIQSVQDVLQVPAFEYCNGKFISGFVAGKPISESLQEALARNDRNAFRQGWQDYTALVRRLPLVSGQQEDFRQSPIFHDMEGTCECLAIGHVDLITENIIRSGDRLWNIDYEWIVDTPVPVKFLFYRAAVVFYHKNRIWFTNGLTLETLLDWLEIGQERQTFARWEERFSRMIHERSPLASMARYMVEARDIGEWDRFLPLKLVSTLYHSMDGRFSEESSVTAEIVNKPDQTVDFRFDRPISARYLRWDPCEGVFVRLSGIEFTVHGGNGGNGTNGGEDRSGGNGEPAANSVDNYVANGLETDGAIVFPTADPQVFFDLGTVGTINRVVIHAKLTLLDYRALESQLVGPVRAQQERAQANLAGVQAELTAAQTAAEQAAAARASLQDERKRLMVTLEHQRQTMHNLKFINQYLKKRIERSEQSEQALRRTVSWRITAPIRIVRTWSGRLRNPLTQFRQLEPVGHENVRINPDGLLASHGKDPKILLDGGFQKGLHFFSWDGMASERILLKLYCNYGGGFNEFDTIPLGHLTTEYAHHERFVYFSQPVRQLRLDPGENAQVMIGLNGMHEVHLSLPEAVRIGIAMLSRQTGINRLRLFAHMARLALQGRRAEAEGLFRNVLKRHGEGSLVLDNDQDAYQAYIHDCEPDAIAIEAQRAATAAMPDRPLISIVVPVYNTDETMLREMIESVRSQTYGDWELCLADGHSAKSHVRPVLESYAHADNRIRIALLAENLGIAGNSNAALELATGEYVALLDHDDLLPPWALFSVADAIVREGRPDVLYSDEDKITFDGKTRFFPHFKPQWSPDLLRSYNYITHLFVARRTLVAEVGNFLPGFDGSQDHDLILRTTERANKIVHIPQILYHWRSHSESTAESQGNKEYTLEAGVCAIQAHLDRLHLAGTVGYNRQFGFYTVQYQLTATPLVSILIPNYEHKDDLKRCLDSIYDKTTYPLFEVVVIENNSRSDDIFAYYEAAKAQFGIQVVCWESLFNFSAINNFGVGQARGDILLFLNNDTEVITPDWIEQMLQYAQRRDVGCVGARLYYGDDTVQHAGVIVGFGGVAGHAFSRLPRSAPGYMARSIVVQNTSAVTAACMMIRRSVFEQVGGFDETLEVAFNDIDLCMKIRALGLYIVYTPHAELYHHESTSRGSEDTEEKRARFLSEIECFRSRWHEVLDAGDPFYSPHLDLEQMPYRISGK